MHRRHVIAAGALLAPGIARAAWPERPVTLIVPWAAGGGSDAIARVCASGLQGELGVPVNVVNRTGGNGVVGHAAIAAAAPDGYGIGLATMEITVFRALGLSPLTVEAYAPIARLAGFAAGIMVAADSPHPDAAALLAAVRAAPAGRFKAGGAGQGGAWHIALGGLLLEAGIDARAVRYVPMAGASAALQDLVSGGLDFVTCSPVEAKALLDAGRVRALAVMAERRLGAFPQVPTLREATGSAWTMGSWFALVAPRGLAPEAATRLRAATRRVWEGEAFQGFLRERSFEPAWEEGEAFAGFAAGATAGTDRVLAALGLKA